MEAKVLEEQGVDVEDEFELIELGSVSEETKGQTGKLPEGFNNSMA